jgi:ornithine cyclodeaminase/alanine dehydrogenase-like protein (mu-crystallin family)
MPEVGLHVWEEAFTLHSQRDISGLARQDLTVAKLIYQSASGNGAATSIR